MPKGEEMNLTPEEFGDELKMFGRILPDERFSPSAQRRLPRERSNCRPGKRRIARPDKSGAKSVPVRDGRKK